MKNKERAHFADMKVFSDKKNYWLLNHIVPGFLNLYFNDGLAKDIHFHGNIPEQGPALVLAKHQCFTDILVEGQVIHEETGRWANYIMRNTLRPQWFLEMLGGIPIIRGVEVSKAKNKEKRKVLLESAIESKQRAHDYAVWLLDQGQIVIIHPEGARCKGFVGPMHGINMAYTIMKKYNLTHDAPLEIIMMGIQYHEINIMVYARGFGECVADDISSKYIDNTPIRTLNDQGFCQGLYEGLDQGLNEYESSLEKLMSEDILRLNPPHNLKQSEFAKLVQKYIAELSRMQIKNGK